VSRKTQKPTYGRRITSTGVLTRKLLKLNVEAECSLQFPNSLNMLNGDTIWKLLESAYEEKYLLRTITILSGLERLSTSSDALFGFLNLIRHGVGLL
jgi:hypothetical protein